MASLCVLISSKACQGSVPGGAGKTKVGDLLLADRTRLVACSGGGSHGVRYLVYEVRFVLSFVFLPVFPIRYQFEAILNI